MCYNVNIFYLSFMSSIICCRLSSCILKCRSAVSHDTFSSLADKSIMILCFLSWYVSLNCWRSYSFCLCLWSHSSWKNFSVLAKESIKRFLVCQSRFCVFCCDIFLSFSAVLLLVVYFFDPILLETTPVQWLKNQLNFLFRYLIIWRIYGFMFWIPRIKNELEYVRK